MVCVVRNYTIASIVMVVYFSGYWIDDCVSKNNISVKVRTIHAGFFLKGFFYCVCGPERCGEVFGSLFLSEFFFVVLLRFYRRR